MHIAFFQTDYDHFLCSDEMLLQMKPLIGVLRDKVPKKSDGTVGPDIVKMIKTFRSGMVVEVGGGVTFWAMISFLSLIHIEF